MKFVVAGFALALSGFTALADSTTAPPTFPPATPLRTAHVTGKISAIDASDKYGGSSKELCKINGDIAVYGDTKTTLEHQIVPLDTACDYKLGAKNMRVEVAIFANVEDASKDTPAEKIVSANVSVFEKESGSIYYNQTTMAGSEDVAVRSIILDSYPMLFQKAKLPKGTKTFRVELNVTEDKL